MNEIIKQQSEAPKVYDQITRNVEASQGLDLSRVAAISAVAAIAITGNGLSSPESAEAATPKTQKIERTASSPYRKMDRLPGWKLKVSPEKHENLKASTVKLVRRLKNPGQYDFAGWEPFCTANVIALPKQNMQDFPSVILSTASHCIGIGDKNGFNFSPDQPAAINVVDELQHELAVIDPSEQPELNAEYSGKGGYSFMEPTIIGKVNGVSMSQRGEDITFLSVTPVDERAPDQKAKKLSEFKRTVFGATSLNSKPGQQVALAGIPDASGNKLLSPKGRFIGYYNGNALVAIKARSSSVDACNFGASGSSARLADGRTLGPLSIRVNTGYRNGETQYNDVFYFDQRTQTTRSYLNAKYWERVQRTLDIDLTNFDTICGFSGVYKDTAVNLMNGFTQLRNPGQTPAITPETGI